MQHEIHASGLVKRLGLFSAFIIVASSMIGSGVFKKVAPMSVELGNTWWVLAAWFCAGAITWFGAITNAEVAGLIAEPGGQYAYFKKMYGRIFAYFYGWTAFAVVQTATTASLGFVFAMSVNQLVELPGLSPAWEQFSLFGVFFPFANFGIKAVTMLLVITLTVINCFGVHYGKYVANVFTITVVIGIFFVIFFGLTSDVSSLSNLGKSVEIPKISASSLGFFGAFFAAMMQAFWAYEGWNTLGFLGGEVKNPYRTIPLALTFGVLFVMGIYMVINFTYLIVLPVETIISLNQNTNTIAAVAVAEKFMGDYGALLITLLIMVATFGSSNNSILTSPRIYFAMAKDRLFFKEAAGIHPKTKAPVGSLIIQCIWTCLLVFSGSFDQLTDMLIFAAFIFYGLGAYGVFVLRKKMPDAPRSFKVYFYPWLPGFFIAFCAVLVTVSVIERPLESLFGTLLILIGWPFYLWWNSTSKR